MDTETMLTMRARRPRVKQRRLGLALSALALTLGCYTQKPSGESAPSAPAAAPEPEAPAEQAAPPPPPPPAALEQKKEEPASGAGAVPQSPSAAPSRSTLVPAPAKPAARKRSSAGPEDAAEKEIGGSADDSERDAPALRQRLDRAYRAGSPDCPSARERKKAVCDLATQICQLTDRDPNVASVAEYCSQAKQRCTQAEQRTQERCPD